MPEILYRLGARTLLDELFPPAELIDEGLGLKTRSDVIAHFTRSSLIADGFESPDVTVADEDGGYVLRIDAQGPGTRLESFAEQHVRVLAPDAAGRAIAGRELMRRLGVWNPMAGYHVNASPADGACKWRVFPPLGLNVIGQKGVLLMHYPPWQVLHDATFLDCMTMFRWSTVLRATGLSEDQIGRYRTIVDVNPIAAPGSGQSEYPNDYLPIMMASAFFGGEGELDYIRRMLEIYLNGPEARGSRCTLPLIICGSPLYDPQAPGWFRTAYTDVLPKDKNGVPLVDVLQTGSFRIRPDSERETPYMIANHMIAAGVTGRCTTVPGEMPDIRKYEAQDLVAASFLTAYAGDADLDPLEAKRRACRRWFGNDTGEGAPVAPAARDRQVICALAQMDLFFAAEPKPHPVYSFEEAMARCAGAGNEPCGQKIGPGGGCGA